MYSYEDFEKFSSHLGKKYIIWYNKDCEYSNKNRRYIINKVKNDITGSYYYYDICKMNLDLFEINSNKVILDINSPLLFDDIYDNINQIIIYTYNNMNIISYCCGTWPSVGGVARYDTQLSLIFPERKFFSGPQEKDKMLEYLKTCKNPIVITDNHLACDIPNEYPILLVHHGVAQTHAYREPEWDPYWRDLCCNGQKKMLSYRNPENTWIISCSQFCTHEFSKYYPEIYPKFLNKKILHCSELNEETYKKEFNNKPIILGNWQNVNKGKNVIVQLIKNLPDFQFKQLQITNKNESIDSFNKKKQNIYLNSDIFLQISLCEGNSYASLDALMNGLIVVASDVGLFYKDVPENCFVKLNWKRKNDIEYINEKINYAWANRYELSKNAREWYLKNCRFADWEKKMKDIVNEFYNMMY